MKTFFSLTFFFFTVIAFAQDAEELKADSSKIKIGHRQPLSVKQGRLLTMNSANYYQLPGYVRSPEIIPEFRVQLKARTRRPALNQVKTGFPLWMQEKSYDPMPVAVPAESKDPMPVLVPDSSVHYHLKIVGEGK